jgi:hypothetical protein
MRRGRDDRPARRGGLRPPAGRGRTWADPPSRPVGRLEPGGREAGHDYLGAGRHWEDLAVARVGGPAGSGSPYRLHDRTAGPARYAALLARHSSGGQSNPSPAYGPVATASSGSRQPAAGTALSILYIARMFGSPWTGSSLPSTEIREELTVCDIAYQVHGLLPRVAQTATHSVNLWIL